VSARLTPAFVLAAAVAAAQEPARFASEVGLVELDVAVTRDGRPVGGLRAADFEVRDAGVVQQIELVERSRSRVQAILLLDTSGSVAGEKLEQLKRAARAFVEGLSPEDTVTLLSFSYRVRQLARPHLTPASAVPALQQLAAGGSTAVFDAVVAATALADPRQGRPVLLVFSDGDDRTSWLTERRVLEAARRTDVVVHAIGFTEAPRLPRDISRRLPNEKPRLARSPQFLSRLVEATGGRLFHADAPSGLGPAFLAALEDLRERYLLRYEPAGVPSGGWHPVEVRVQGRGLNVRHRPGYQASP
jgi:Ca-activated chloride channel family protein